MARFAYSAPWSAMEALAVFLVGFMASGKSSVGQELARRLGWRFVDLDLLIRIARGADGERDLS